MPAVYTPGPIHHFVQFRGGSQPLYLGTAVVAPDPEQELFKLEVMNDLSGRSVPFQLVQDGEKWLVITTLNRFDYTILQAVRNLGSGGAGVGSESGLARGTLVLGVSDFVLITVFAYGATPPGAVVPVQGLTGTPGQYATGLPGYRAFASCNLRKYKESTAGTRVLEAALAIECLPVFNPVTFGFTTYEEGGTSPLLALIS